jgi:mRNA-degrading endonuclease toxin of MazEF toxin-antitoxin module
MAPWEIWTFDFPVEGTHPCVVFSNAARLVHPLFDRVNVLLCRTLRGALQREVRLTEILLDRADGLDWETLCRVDALHFVLKSGLRERRGLVSKERRRLICQRMLQVFPFEF